MMDEACEFRSGESKVIESSFNTYLGNIEVTGVDIGKFAFLNIIRVTFSSLWFLVSIRSFLLFSKFSVLFYFILPLYKKAVGL